MFLRVIMLGVCMSTALATPAWAASGTQMIALHLKAHTPSGACGSWDNTACVNFATAGHLQTAYDVYVVAIDPDAGRSISGTHWGIYYNGTPQAGADILSWTGCGGIEFQGQDWPASGSGITVNWFNDNCQVNQAVLGAFHVYAYSEDSLTVGPVAHPGPVPFSLFQVMDCDLNAYDLDWNTGRGAVVFSAGGSTAGFNPCTATGVLPSLPNIPPPPPPPPPPPTIEHEDCAIVHIAPSGESCAGAPLGYDGIVTSAPLPEPGDYTIYLLAAPKVPDSSIGLSLLQIGIAYPSGEGTGIKMQAWHSCTDSETPFYNWPDSGSVNTLRWGTCKSDTLQVAGYFQVTVYDPSAFALIPSPQYGVAPIFYCHSGGAGILPSRLGWVSFGGATWAGDVNGCNPLHESCPDTNFVPVHGITWGKLKTKY